MAALNGKSQRAIAREFKIGRNTVSLVVALIVEIKKIKLSTHIINIVFKNFNLIIIPLMIF